MDKNLTEKKLKTTQKKTLREPPTYTANDQQTKNLKRISRTQCDPLRETNTSEPRERGLTRGPATVNTSEKGTGPDSNKQPAKWGLGSAFQLRETNTSDPHRRGLTRGPATADKWGMPTVQAGTDPGPGNGRRKGKTRY